MRGTWYPLHTALGHVDPVHIDSLIREAASVDDLHLDITDDDRRLAGPERDPRFHARRSEEERGVETGPARYPRASGRASTKAPIAVSTWTTAVWIASAKVSMSLMGTSWSASVSATTSASSAAARAR